VTGADELEEFSRQAALYGFAPVSTEAPPGRDRDFYDILISTDVLAEGVNLQQCRHTINRDVPWNPMRLVQRHGRIDRIGSTQALSASVFCERSLWPNGSRRCEEGQTGAAESPAAVERAGGTGGGQSGSRCPYR
jgi:superfamily II DNA/RNA helicase